MEAKKYKGSIIFSTYPEMLRICPEMWDYPVCFPTDRANLIHGKGMYVISPPVGDILYIYLNTTWF